MIHMQISYRARTGRPRSAAFLARGTPGAHNEDMSLRRMPFRICSGLLAVGALVLAGGCSMHPERKQVVEEGDFISKIPPEEREALNEQIAELKDQTALDFRNAELHRRLAVLYRLRGTPPSRLLSSQEIDRAIALDPGNALYRVEQGLTYAARRFVGDAEQSFLEATRLDPRCSEAWYQLGRLEQFEYLKTMCFPDRLVKAIDYFEKAYRYNRKHEETLLSLAFLHSLRQMHGTGLGFATRAVRFYPKNARAHLLCGYLYTRLKEFDKAEQAFATGFLLLSEEERRPYEDIGPLLSGEERELYGSSLPERRRDWERRFWIENDPTPSTDVNERRLEHFARVVYADRALSLERLDLAGPETDRGAALIRFGLPDRKLYDLGSGTSGAWVAWRYDTPQGPMMLYFCDEFLNGNFQFPVFDYYGQISRRMLDAAPQRYEYPIRYDPFPMSIRTACFRGGEERTRLELSVAVPDSLAAAKSRSWDLVLSLFDRELTRFSMDRLTARPDSLLRVRRLGSSYLVYDAAIEMLPRDLGVTCAVELSLEQDRKKAVRRLPLTIRDLHGRSLKISSVKLAVAAPDGSCTDVLDPLPAYPRRSRICLAYEVYNLKAGEDGSSRYRLTYAIRTPDPGADGSPASLQKTLSYMWSTIRGEKGRNRPYIESSFEQRAAAASVADNLQIDLGSLEQGSYELILYVEDLVAGATTAESVIFSVNE